MTDLRTPITIPRFNRMMYCLLLPLYTAETDGQFFSVRSMVRHALEGGQSFGQGHSMLLY